MKAPYRGLVDMRTITRRMDGKTARHERDQVRREAERQRRVDENQKKKDDQARSGQSGAATAAPRGGDRDASSEHRRVVPIEEAIQRIGDGEYVHTFMSSPIALLGADHERAGLIDKMREKGVEDAGAQASAMGHTLVIVDYADGAPLFIEAKPPAKAEGRS